MLSAPTITTASSAAPMSDADHPTVTSDRSPSRRYVTGFHAATACNQPDSWFFGTYDVVRNRNGKNSRNIELTAPGFPVFSATA